MEKEIDLLKESAIMNYKNKDFNRAINELDKIKTIDINYFEKIALYGVIIKGIAVTLIYQFIISFRNSTRKK